MKKRFILSFVFALIIGIVFGLSLSIKSDLFSSLKAQNEKTVSVAQNTPEVSKPVFNIEDAVINVASSAGKAVVSISTEHTEKIKGQKRIYFNQPFGGGGGNSPFGQDEFLDKFFNDFMGNMPEREFKRRGLGSGVIINNEGYILTNEHVINEADKVTVTLPDGREFKGEIKGQDSRSDLAIIKINAKNLPFAPLGDSDNVRIGQWVVAVGNPYSFAMQNPEPTVTVGVISALHRSLGKALSQERDYNDLIQTDAAINPGNSGGPLVNLKGEVIGINVAIFSTTGGYQGIGFAIPSNTAQRIIARLIEGKKIVYGWLGISVQDLNEDLAKHFGLADKNGVLVSKILENSPALKSGMKEGDIIKKVDAGIVDNVRTLLSLVGKAEVGRKVKILVIRDKRPVTLDVVIGERPQSTEEIKEVQEKQGSFRGMEVQSISEEIAKRFRIIDKEKGVIVVDIEPNSPAEDAGLMPGDVISEINKQPIRNFEEYQRIVKNLKADALIKTSRGYFILKEESGK